MDPEEQVKILSEALLQIRDLSVEGDDDYVKGALLEARRIADEALLLVGMVHD